jgi:hypothetical protein
MDSTERQPRSCLWPVLCVALTLWPVEGMKCVGMRQFSIAHLAALATLLVGAGLAMWLPRRYPGRWIRWARLF